MKKSDNIWNKLSLPPTDVTLKRPYAYRLKMSLNFTYILCSVFWILAILYQVCRVFSIHTSIIKNTVTYSGFSIHDGNLLHSKSQYTTVKHSRKLFEHTYTSDLYGTGTLAPIQFFQQDLLWQSSITHFHSYSQKASKHKSGQSIVGLSVLLHTTTAPRRIYH
jgi:hypothetical protein